MKSNVALSFVAFLLSSMTAFASLGAQPVVQDEIKLIDNANHTVEVSGTRAAVLFDLMRELTNSDDQSIEINSMIFSKSFNGIQVYAGTGAQPEFSASGKLTSKSSDIVLDASDIAFAAFGEPMGLHEFYIKSIRCTSSSCVLSMSLSGGAI